MRNNKRLHIMHLVLSLETGGCENGIVNLINNMNPERFKVSVCCLDNIGELAERILQNRKNVILAKRDGRPRLKDVWCLSRLLRREQVDILHTHGWGTVALGYLSAKVARVPTVIHGEHGGLHLGSPLKMFAQMMLFRLVDCTITVSADLQERLSSVFNLDKKRFHPIINGVDVAKFVTSNLESRENIREQYGITDNSCLIGTVGRLVKWKRHDVLVDAVEKLIRQGKEVNLIIVGDGPERQSLEELIDSKGVGTRIFLAGRSENVGAYLAAMDIFVLTSSVSAATKSAAQATEFEGISNALLEAMSCGLPVVVSNVGGCSEVVTNGQTGFLFESNDMASLEQSLSLLVSDSVLRATMGRSARESMEKSFSLSAMVKGYEDFYQHIAGDR